MVGYSAANRSNVSGVQPKIDQLKGQAFLQAYNNLKGAGQITEIEGTKAENATARLNQAQNKEDFVKALQDLKEVITSAKSRAEKQTEGAPAPAPATDKASTPATTKKTINFGDL